jgi:hypothetical protein
MKGKKMQTIKLEISGNEIRKLHDDLIDWGKFGKLKVRRASHVEFNNKTGFWFVKSAKTGKMIKDDFKTRELALAFEKEYYTPGGKGWKELTN